MRKRDYSISSTFTYRQFICRWGMGVCLVFLVSLFFGSVFAEDENVIEYRRHLVPKEQIERFPFLSPSLPRNRRQFEHMLEQVKPKPENQGDNTPYLSKIVLKARLEGRQLASGQGFFTLHPRSIEKDSVPLEPLALAVSALRWSDDTEAVLFCEPDGTPRLTIPQKTDSNEYDSLQFRWSLQSRKSERNGIVFDFVLPPCFSIELQIDLPESQTLTATTGIVLPGEKNGDVDSEFRTWRVLLGHRSHATLTVTPDKTLASVKQKSAFRQDITYTIRPEGLETITQITFDKVDPHPKELFLELEQPLRPNEVRYGVRPEEIRYDEASYGGRSVPWTKSPLSSDTTEVRIDLSPFVDEEPQNIVIWSLGPLQENQRWTLPRVRVTSPDVFWTETRCAVRVRSPLRTRYLSSDQAVRDEPRNSFDWADREVHVFQFFQDDAQVGIEVIHSSPRITVNSVTQTELGNNEIRSTVYLESSVTEGEHFILNFPVSEHWIIDSVISYPPPTGTVGTEDNPSLSWDVLEAQQTLSVQLNRPLIPRRPVKLQLTCRFINSSQNQFRLAELTPLTLPQRYGETHYIATQFDLTDYSPKSSADVPASIAPDTILLDGNPLKLMGNVYLLDSRSQDFHFELERTPSNYLAEISGNVFVGDEDLKPTFHIHCEPVDSSIDRVFVHFTPSSEKNTEPRWDWSLVGDPDSTRSLRARKLSPDELNELLPMFEPQNRSEDLERGEVWEIRLAELQSTSFELSATSFIPLADSMQIPFVSLPLASQQKGSLTIEAPQHFDYQIVSSRLDSIPIAPAPWNQYQNIRAAFHYDPQEELRRSQYTPLLLQKTTQEERIDAAWVWSLRLDSLYEPEGFVRNKALFLVENKGKDVLRIKLPHGIDAHNISTVLLDLEQISWQHDKVQGTIGVVLPASRRFVSIAINYTYQDLPLVQQRKLRPRYPSADVPILSGSWISWFPPEFDVSLRRTAIDSAENQDNPIVLSKALDYLTAGTTYRTFLGSIWDDVFGGRQRKAEAETAAQYFFEEVVETLQKGSVSTWGDLFGNEKVLSDATLRLGNDIKRTVETKLLIDKQALTFLGITPATPLGNVASINEHNVRELFERAGLVLLVALNTRSDRIQEYVFTLTTPTTLSLNRQFQSIPLGHSSRMVPFDVFDSVAKSSAQWIPAPRWLSETTLSSIPWSISVQDTHRSALTANWNAYELSMDAEQPLYIVHRQKASALQWIAFLFLALITCRKPFSSLIVLFVLLIVCELIARSVAPCYVGIPSGAFLGVLVSVGFILIRSQFNRHSFTKPENFSHHDSTECSVSFVPTSLLVRCITLGVFLSCFGGIPGSATAQMLPERIQALSQKELYQVVYPTDSEHQVIGSDVLVPFEFYDLLYRAVEAKNQTALPQWSITKAVYQGSLIYGTSGLLECADDFKAVYDIRLDSSRATISLPNLPAVQGRFSWNARPIFPTGEAKNEALSFLIENETPGKHVLEIALSPEIVPRGKDDMFQIAFAIPKVPDSTLRINVPPNMPPMTVPEALGTVTDNASLSPVFIAELGAIPQLSLQWADDPHQNETLTSEVEQFFWIQAKQSKVELYTLFRFRIDGEKVRHLKIQTDPRWLISGQFRCDEHQLVPRSETDSDSSNNVSPIVFQSSVSGPITLRANFVLRDFNGIGNLRLPQFKALRSHITKSMLAISADPHLELNCPLEGRNSGFEAGWQEATAISFPNNSIWDIIAPYQRRSDVFAEPLEAQYDLTKTEPTWTLNIRAKKIIPQVLLAQSIQFDAGRSKVHISGEFTADSNVFQQYFSTDHPIQIETMEVWDSRNNLVESRYQRISPETMPEAGVQQYLIFFKNSVSGKYTITIRGFLETEIHEESPQQLFPVPVLTFDEVQMTDHSINLFRTSAVIADIALPKEGHWTKSDVSPAAPESFTQSVPLGTWRKTATTETASEIVATEPVQFSLSPNRPKMQGKTVLSLQLADSDEQRTMTIVFTGNITSGELKSLHFRWDERCKTIQSVEPFVPWSFEHSGGQTTLVLSPTEPMRGQQQFKIVVSLDSSGIAVALPNVFPLPKGIDQFVSELFVNLPHQQEGEIIPWDLKLLEAVEDQTKDASRLLFQALGTDFRATINRVESKLTATFYDIGFLIKREGTVIGVATIDMRNRGQDSFVLKMPQGYEVIQISSAGLLLNRSRLAKENRWKINIGTNNYPMRLSILFRASLPQPLKQWSREQITSALQFPFLEGVAVQETIWAAVFEGHLPPLKMTSVLDRHGTMSEPNDLGEHVPLPREQAVFSLIGLNLIREHNLLRVLDSCPTPVSARKEEVRHWYLHWSEEWNTVADKVDFQLTHWSLASQNIKPKLITRPIDSVSEREVVRSFVETMSAQTGNALRIMKEQQVQDKFGTMLDTGIEQLTPILNSQVYWQGRMSAETMQYFFGVEEGVFREIRLTSVPVERQWSHQLADHIWIWISIILLLPILVLLSVRWVYWMELWLQFPHFWGMVAGVLLWTFLPQSFVGLSLIVLTFVSLFRPSWPRYRSVSKPY